MRREASLTASIQSIVPSLQARLQSTARCLITSTKPVTNEALELTGRDGRDSYDEVNNQGELIAIVTHRCIDRFLSFSNELR